MKIAGLQRVSTIDYPGEICCVIFLWGCNFRCGFCYNSSLVIRDQELGISEEEFFDFLSKRMGKLDAVCISGGEPLMSLDFGFVRRIKDMGFKVKIDTNGSFPERLQELVSEGLVDYIAMDVKSCREDYCEVVNVNVDMEKIEESIRIVNEFENSEFRTTVVPGLHDVGKLVEMGKWMHRVCGGKPKMIFLQGFKRGESMIDSSFMEKSEVLEGELLRMKMSLDELFEEVGVRV
ncbi:MAG: anaerobic ribonucleoside-triphosphate reductase activating protein [archaeon]